MESDAAATESQWRECSNGVTGEKTRHCYSCIRSSVANVGQVTLAAESEMQGRGDEHDPVPPTRTELSEKSRGCRQLSVVSGWIIVPGRRGRPARSMEQESNIDTASN